MFFVKTTLSIIIILLVFFPGASFAQQRIKDFYLSNIKEDGSRDWEVEGDEAHIFDEHVDIDNMKANYYGPKDDVVVTSDSARLDKTSMDVELKKNVNVINKDGTHLKTESLNWQQKSNMIETDDWVTTTKDEMSIKAKGLTADTAFKKADFEKDVEVTFPGEEGSDQMTTIVCSGPLEIEYQGGTAVFNDDVVVTHSEGKLFSDKATVFFNNEEKKVNKIVSEGNVKIMRDDNVTFAQKATYFGQEQRLILEGRPRLIYFQSDDKKSILP